MDLTPRQNRILGCIVAASMLCYSSVAWVSIREDSRIVEWFDFIAAGMLGSFLFIIGFIGVCSIAAFTMQIASLVIDQPSRFSDETNVHLFCANLLLSLAALIVAQDHRSGIALAIWNWFNGY